MNDRFRLSIQARDEVTDALTRSLTHAVSLVDPGASLPASLDQIAPARRLVLSMHDALDATDGKQPPALADVRALCDFADRIDTSSPIRLLVHCHEGRSRSSAAAAILMLRLGVADASNVFDRILAARKPVWPNWTMIEHGDAALSCGGALEHACRQAYVRMRECFPAWVEDPRPENAVMRT